jgi:hypothetical protein
MPAAASGSGDRVGNIRLRGAPEHETHAGNAARHATGNGRDDAATGWPLVGELEV